MSDFNPSNMNEPYEVPIFDRSELPTFRNGRAGTFQRTSATRWEEHHGWGSLRPDGSGNIDFNDNTPDGDHSHYNYRPGVGRVAGRDEGEPHGSWTDYPTPR